MRKIGLVLVAIMQSSLLYSMKLSTSYTYKGTKINVTKGSPYDIDGRVDFVVFEKNEQQLLFELFADHWLVGHVKTFCDRPVYIYHNNVDSASDDDDDSCYKNLVEKSKKSVYEKCLRSRSIEVTEPLIFTSQYSGKYYYYAETRCKGKNKCTSGRKYFGDEVIEAASKDLALCYKNVLRAGLSKLGTKQEKSIAFPALGTAVDFPREKAALAAVPAILKFIKNHPKAYDRIELFVKKRSEFTLYNKMLNVYIF